MSNTPTTKICTKCGVEKGLEEFHVNNGNNDGRSGACKVCACAYAKSYRLKNPDYLSKQKEWRTENKDTARAQAKKYRSKCPVERMYRGAKSRAKAHLLPFDLKRDDIVIPSHCPVLGVELRANIGGVRVTSHSPTLDRIVPALGYVSGNVRVISHKANAMKNSGTLPEMLLIGQDAFRLIAARNAYLESELERLKKAQ